MFETVEMKMIYVDECGDEYTLEKFTIPADLDEDSLSVWENMKIEKAEKDFPEASCFYFENVTLMEYMILEDMSKDF